MCGPTSWAVIALSLVLSCGDDSGSDPTTEADAAVDAAAPSDATAPIDAGAPILADSALPTACVRNADCANSAEAARVSGLRCPSELYCLEGTCHGSCSPSCRDIREDVNSCAGGAYCDSALLVCRYKPIRCETAATCPAFRKPLADGGLGTWTCDNGECAYPGATYTTR
jgi:hypothetical protein